MDRNTIIAIVLCVIVITVGMTIQTSFFAPDYVETTETVETVDNAVTASVAESAKSTVVALGSDGDSSPFRVQNKSLDIEFDPAGATISSIQTLEHEADGKPAELVFKEDGDVNPFMVYLNNGATALSSVFSYTIETKEIPSKGTITQVTFTRDFEDQNGSKFTLEKKYAIPDNNEYMIQLAITLRSSDGSVISLNDNGTMYSLSVGPQVGPSFESLSRNYDYRRVYMKRSDKSSKKVISTKNGFYTSSDPVEWMGLVGKYFAMLIIPESDGIISSVKVVEAQGKDDISQRDTIYLNRAASNASSVTDVYSFYCGPQLAKTLKIYDRSVDNIFGLENHNLKKALDVSWLSWLETILKFFLDIFYKICRNYGVAIILLTVIVKLLLQPISKKGMDSTAKMSALSPKMEEIKAKYPDNPEAQNAAIAKLYKEEGINPMGSCIPMLIQFPIFIALYGLLNKNFELRGALFIPGWIPDLSVPDTIATLPFNIPLLGTQIHLLPIIYTVSMIFSMKITQTGSTNSQQQGMMAFMTYGMPIMFFFVMYNAPSGLLVYWTVTNAISIGQQLIVNKKKGGIYRNELEAKDKEKEAKKAAKKKRR